MSELRKDPVVGRWVIISSERGKRPSSWAGQVNRKGGGFCPFCPGHEDKTPPEIYAKRPLTEAQNVPGWQIRVVPNKFPALKVEGTLHAKGFGNYDMMNGVGAHEVIIETPKHAADLTDLSDAQATDILLTYRERMVDLARDARFKYVLVFKNHGGAAGASLEHSHSQIIATPIIPKRVSEELEGSKRFYNHKERCVFCDMIQYDIKSKVRIISRTENFVALAPFAPRFPYETWLLPMTHFSHFEKMPETLFGQLANILKDTLRRINSSLGYPPFNFVLHSAPVQVEEMLVYHWHFEVIPKLTSIAGFEWGTGFYINPTAPEVAAEHLRKLETTT